MPLINQTFSQLITFTRASSATYVDARGLIQSASTNVPRFDYNPSTLAPRGILIEEQRTNLLTYSEQFDNAAWTKGANITVTANAVAAPDGSTTADLVVSSANADSSLNQVFQQATVGSSATYTASLWVRAAGANQDIVIRQTANAVLVANTTVSVTSTWQRITVTFTAATNPGFAIRPDGVSNLNVYIWGAQLEAGSFATSYIPTVASQVTRAADLASVNNLSPWYNMNEGTLYVETGPTVDNIYPTGSVLTDGTSANNILIQAASPATSQQFYVVSNGVAQVNLATQAFSSTLTKTAAAYKTNDFAYSTQGAVASTDVAGSIPTVSQLVIGAERTSSFFNGHIRRIVFYPSRLSNANLQTITA